MVLSCFDEDYEMQTDEIEFYERSLANAREAPPPDLETAPELDNAAASSFGVRALLPTTVSQAAGVPSSAAPAAASSSGVRALARRQTSDAPSPKRLKAARVATSVKTEKDDADPPDVDPELHEKKLTTSEQTWMFNRVRDAWVFSEFPANKRVKENKGDFRARWLPKFKALSVTARIDFAKTVLDAADFPRDRELYATANVCIDPSATQKSPKPQTLVKKIYSNSRHVFLTYFSDSWKTPDLPKDSQKWSCDRLAFWFRGTKEFASLSKKLAMDVGACIERTKAIHFSWSLELCPNTWAEKHTAVLHVHLALDWIFPFFARDRSKFALGGVEPTHRRHEPERLSKRARTSGPCHYYCQIQKIGMVCNDFNFQRKRDFPISGRWVTTWLQAGKITTETAEQVLFLFFLCGCRS